MKRPRRILLFVLLLGAALAGVKWLRAFGHPALTAYVAQLRSQGERLTLQELSAANSPSTNNTLVDMAQVLTKPGQATLQRCLEKHDFLETVQRGLEGEPL